ncbi:MAG: dienelactone hydrolase family protein [Sandaracinus sp.]|nr:dienelactone hydrolase family protein [Sandaracinus sp.]
MTKALLAITLLGLFVSVGHAQTRSAAFDLPAEIEVVGAPAAGERLPLVVFLPWTGGEAREMFDAARAQMPFERYVALLPRGRFGREDYLPAFGQFVTWMEERVLADLELAGTRHAIDPARVYLVGFSLGGDTSWALLTRHPEVFAGAVVLGSRTGARPRGSAARVFRERRRRVAFGMGEADEAVRVRGVERAFARAEAAHLDAVLVRYPGGHGLPPPETLRALLARVMA